MSSAISTELTLGLNLENEVEIVHVIETNGSQAALYIPQGKSQYVYARRQGHTVYGPPVGGKHPTIKRYIAVASVELGANASIRPYADFYIVIIEGKFALTYGEVRKSEKLNLRFSGRPPSLLKGNPSKDNKSVAPQVKRGVKLEKDGRKGKSQTNKTRTPVTYGNTRGKAPNPSKSGIKFVDPASVVVSSVDPAPAKPTLLPDPKEPSDAKSDPVNTNTVEKKKAKKLRRGKKSKVKPVEQEDVKPAIETSDDKANTIASPRQPEETKHPPDWTDNS